MLRCKELRLDICGDSVETWPIVDRGRRNYGVEQARSGWSQNDHAASGAVVATLWTPLENALNRGWSRQNSRPRTDFPSLARPLHSFSDQPRRERLCDLQQATRRGFDCFVGSNLQQEE